MTTADNPFNFPGWLLEPFGPGGGGGASSGASTTGNALNVGVANQPSPNDTTIVQAGNPNNTVLSVWNAPIIASLSGPSPAEPGLPIDQGCIGIYGRTSGTTRSFGVCGQADVGGCGVYGISSGVAGEESIFPVEGSLPEGFTSPPDPSGTPASLLELGIGVAGRALHARAIGIGFEDSLETLFPYSIGVLGHSSNGVGLRGHAGSPLATQTIEEIGLGTYDAVCAARSGPGPGAVLSAGRLTSLNTDDPAWAGTMLAGGPPQTMSVDFLPQLQLVPTLIFSQYEGLKKSDHTQGLPAAGSLGDIFVAAGPVANVDDRNPRLECQIFICVRPGDGTVANPTGWKPFLLDDSIEVTNPATLMCFASSP
jgi:hypothetical protein